MSIQPVHAGDQKVTAARLSRDAYLYIRQSTLYQVANNTESTLRQYDLKGRAVALGWPPDRIHVIDIDQGHSGASAADREGFQHLVAQVSLGRAGIVLGLECSRLARNNADWHLIRDHLTCVQFRASATCCRRGGGPGSGRWAARVVLEPGTAGRARGLGKSLEVLSVRAVVFCEASGGQVSSAPQATARRGRERVGGPDLVSVE